MPPLEPQFSAIIDSSDDAIISKDMDGIIRSWNAGAEKIFGYKASEVIGQSVTILIPPGNLDEEPNILARLRRGEKIDQGNGKYGDRSLYPLPELIFLDLKLPLVNGFEVLEWARTQSWFPSVPVVILSSSVEESDHQKAQQLGARKFLVKPPTSEALAKTYRLFVKGETNPLS